MHVPVLTQYHPATLKHITVVKGMKARRLFAAALMLQVTAKTCIPSGGKCGGSKTFVYSGIQQFRIFVTGGF
jgi:hypothetical protein